MNQIEPQPHPFAKRRLLAGGKLPFDIPVMLKRIRSAVRPFPKAMLFELKEMGFGSPFEQLVACVLSIRTLDETSRPAALELLQQAKSPEEILALDDLAEIIRACTFARQKAANLKRISEILIRDFGGKTPCDFESLTSLPGIGPKCANLILGIACGKARIGVDIHVHRVTNRWGYVQASTPEKTLTALEEKLPEKHWVELNELLVPFGKHICRGAVPKCSVCPVFDFCRRVGVKKSA
jgi:endonuclease-3